MSTADVAVLGAVAGFTIFLGLPMGRVEMQNVRVKTLLNGISAGILAFLLVNILANAGNVLDGSLAAAQSGGSESALARANVNPIGKLKSVPVELTSVSGGGLDGQANNTLTFKPVVPTDIGMGTVLVIRTLVPFVNAPGSTDSTRLTADKQTFRSGDYQAAVQDYNKVLDQYPGGNKGAAAQLKKGFALLELGQRDDGIKELRSLISRYPKSPEALQARDRLSKLGAAGAASKPRPSRPSPRHP